MRILLTASLALVAAGGAYAQGGRSGGNPTGFGSVLFPGTPPTGLVPPPQFRPGFRSGHANGNRRGGFIPVPYAIPIYVGGYGYDPYQQYALQQQPNVTVVMPPAAPAAAPVVINQYFGADQAPAQQANTNSGQNQGPQSAPESSSLRFYQAPQIQQQQPQQQDNQSVTFLIALKDKSVYSAVAYWPQGETLHYVTPDGKHNQVSLALVDRNLSATLNQDQKAELVLPPEPQYH
jgi:hypothetical protein